ncbi:aldehyde dehydrogenase domain-containing protein [Aspergillus pseudoustus]|uniref:Aldehyde dehydrogenase domain-containing protein n=1 Tax=Aspergillus pseudoustus TaxID=1810923 RepID=A0ABR4JTK2_9EURO
MTVPTTYTVPLIISGKDVITESTFDVTNPRTGQIWHSSAASPADAVKAVESAQAAFPAWSKTKPAVRRDILLRAAELFKEREAELRQYQVDETGADEKFVDWILPLTVEQLKDVAGRVTSSLQGSVPICSEEGRSAIIFKEPYGVILGIAPWNAPWPLGCRAVSYALAAGNTVVLKGSELSPRCYWAIVDIFRQAGLPDGCLNLVIHRPQDAAEITNVLIAHASIKKINFTGSTAVGAILSSLAGKHLKPIITELGGKASAIILKDANVEKAAEACTLGSFLHAGQVCMSTERIIVHTSLVESFITAFEKFTEAIFPASGQPPVFVSQLGARKTKTLVSAALESGASVVFGDTTDASSSTTTMRPIVLRDVPKDSDIYYTESFGPTVTIFTFESEEEALAIANDTEYGLAGAVFTEDLATGLRVARQYETGNIHINSMSIHDDVNVPHGGVKKSGFGRFSGTPGIEEYLTSRVVTWQTRS